MSTKYAKHTLKAEDKRGGLETGVDFLILQQCKLSFFWKGAGE